MCFFMNGIFNISSMVILCFSFFMKSFLSLLFISYITIEFNSREYSGCGNGFTSSVKIFIARPNKFDAWNGYLINLYRLLSSCTFSIWYIPTTTGLKIGYKADSRIPREISNKACLQMSLQMCYQAPLKYRNRRFLRSCYWSKTHLPTSDLDGERFCYGAPWHQTTVGWTS